MALTLAQAAAQSTNQLGTGVMEVISTSSVVLDRLPFETINGNAYQYWQEAARPGAEFRAVNAAYAESTGSLTSATESRVILGGDADVDRYLQLTRSTLFDQRATQATLKAKAVNAKFSDSFVNGNTGTDANAFNGLKIRLSGAQVIATGTNGAAINTDSATRQNFFDNLDALLALVPNVEVLYTNAAILAKFRSAARREAASQTTVDSIGRTVDAYNGVPILDIGNKADGTAIIPQTETQGTAVGISGSISAVNFGEGLGDQGVVGLTNGGVVVEDLGQLETKPVFRTRIEWFTGVALFGTRPAARLQGVLAA